MYIELWGRHAWYYLHNISYQRNDIYIKPKLIKKFIELLGTYLPCYSCREHFKQNYKKTNILLEDAIHNIDLLGKYFVDIHNLVNKRNKRKIYNYYEAKKLVSNKNSYHNGICFLSSIIYNIQDKCFLNKDILNITNKYINNKNESINILNNYINSSNNSIEIDYLEQIFKKKSYILNFIEKTPYEQEIYINEKYKLIELETYSEEIENIKYLISVLNNLLYVNKEEIIKEELYKGLDIFFIDLDELLEFIYLFGYLLPNKKHREIFIKILDEQKKYIKNVTNIFNDWYIPFINNVNINTNGMFYLNPLNTIEFNNRLLNILGYDYG